MVMTGDPRLIEMDVLERVTPVIRNAAHPVRLRILDYLRREGEPRTVTEIVQASGGVLQAVVSQHLRILRDQGILRARRSGNRMLYEIANPSVLLLLDCIRRHQTRDDVRRGARADSPGAA